MADEPFVDRVVDFRFRGDWGQGHITRVCTWLMQEMRFRTAPGSTFSVHSGRAGTDNVRAVANGEVEMALTSPSVFTRMAIAGNGLYEGDPMPHLRAVGQIPQNDRLVLALGREFGISSYEELRERKPALTLATGPDPADHTIGFGAKAMMAAAGIDDETFASWGGKYVRHEVPTECLVDFGNGVVDGVVQEALTAPFWVKATEDRDTIILPIEDDVAQKLEAELGWYSRPLQAGYFRGQPDEIPVMDFSDFAMLVRDDLPDDLVHLLTWCLTETKIALERQYAGRDPNRSGITCPMVPANMAATPIPLHPVAEATYKELGYI